MNGRDYLLLAVIAAAAVWAAVSLHRRKKNGCAGDCARCGGCADGGRR